MTAIPEEVIDAIPKGQSMRLDRDVWELLGAFCISEGLRPTDFRKGAEKLIRKYGPLAIAGESPVVEPPSSPPVPPVTGNVLDQLI